MQTLFDTFPFVRIINLRERTDRRRGTERELARIGVPIDGDRVAFHTADRFADADGFPTIGARGSFTSHLACLQQAKAAGASSVLIVEDDIAFHPPEDAILTRILKDLGENAWDVVYFGYLEPEVPDAAPGLHTYGGPTLGGQFYAVQEPYLSTMIAFMESCLTRPPGSPEGGPMFRDGAYNFYRQHHSALRQMLCVPNLATQRRSRTDLHALKWFDRMPGVRLLANQGRRILGR